MTRIGPAPRILAAALVLLAAAALPALGEEEKDPILKNVKEVVKDANKPFTLILTVQVKEGSEEKFEAAFAKAAEGTHKEKGNRRYELSRNPKKPTEYVVYERWQNTAALQDHLKADYIKTLLKELGDLLAGVPEVQVLLPVGGK